MRAAEKHEMASFFIKRGAAILLCAFFLPSAWANSPPLEMPSAGEVALALFAPPNFSGVLEVAAAEDAESADQSASEFSEAEASLPLAISLMEARRLQEALIVLNALVGREGVNQTEVQTLIGLIELNAGRPDLAAARFTRLLQENPDLAYAKQQLALALIRLNRITDARKLLEELRESPEADQSELNFLLGLADIADGKHDAAAKRFREILVNYPERIHVRLELARAFFFAGEDDGARYHFEYVLASKHPPEITATVREFLEKMDERQGWSFSFGMGIAPDTNINSATSHETVRIGDLPFTPSERERSGVGVNWNLGALWRKPIPGKKRLIARGLVSQRNYEGSDFDDLQTHFAVGIRTLRAGGASDYEIFTRRRWFSDKPYSYDFGISFNNTHRFFQRLSIRENLQILRRFHDDESNKSANGDIFFGSVRGVYGLTPVTALEFGLSATRTLAKTETRSQNSYSVSLGVRREFGFGISAGLTGDISYTLYDGVSLGGARRKEEARSLTLTLIKRDWSIFGFAPELAIVRTDNQSNVDIFDYTRTRANFGFTQQF